MGKYTTFDDEMKRLRKMSLIKEDAVTTPPPCCDKPEDPDQEIITSETTPTLSEEELNEIIRKSGGEYTLYSHKGKALGHGSKGEMEKRERQVQYFKHLHEGSDTPFQPMAEVFDRINQVIEG